MLPRHRLFPQLLVVLAISILSALSRAAERIDYSESVYLAKFERHIVITPEGKLTVTEQLGEKIKKGESQLNPSEIEKLGTFFAAWKKLEKSYPTVADGPDISISYGNNTVRSGGTTETPKEFVEAQKLILKLASDALTKSTTPTAP